MSENAPEIEISIPVPENDGGNQTESSPDVVVVETGDSGNDAVDAVVTETAIDHEGRLIRIEDALVALAAGQEEIRAALLAQAETDAVQQEEIAVLEDQIQEVAEEAQEAPESDEEPDREHPFYRNRRFFGRAE